MGGNGVIKTFQLRIVHNFLSPSVAALQSLHVVAKSGPVQTLVALTDQLGRFLATDSQATKGKKCGKTGLQKISEVVYNQPIRWCDIPTRPAHPAQTHKKEDCSER